MLDFLVSRLIILPNNDFFFQYRLGNKRTILYSLFYYNSRILKEYWNVKKEHNLDKTFLLNFEFFLEQDIRLQNEMGKKFFV